MTELEFRKKYESEIDIYSEWGNIIKNNILDSLIDKNYDLSVLLKIPPNPRIKGIESIISKAYYRGKAYKDPYNEITDKVGVRFVVLFVEEIRIIEDIITNNNKWTYSKDKDFEKEKDLKPTEFVYQSQHYILRNNNSDLNTGKFVIPVDTPCEVQIRTLLQHAYSELTHDTIYKPNFHIQSELHRLASRSMALIETTDTIFTKVNLKLEEIVKERNKYIEELAEIYNDKDLKIEKVVSNILCF